MQISAYRVEVKARRRTRIIAIGSVMKSAPETRWDDRINCLAAWSVVSDQWLAG